LASISETLDTKSDRGFVALTARRGFFLPTWHGLPVLHWTGLLGTELEGSPFVAVICSTRHGLVVSDWTGLLRAELAGSPLPENLAFRLVGLILH
jgi:hypothetical protein